MPAWRSRRSAAACRRRTTSEVWSPEASASRGAAGFFVRQVACKAVPFVRIETAAGSGTCDLYRMIADEEEICQIPQDYRRVAADGGQGVPVRGERHRQPRSVWPVRGEPSRCGRVGSRTSHKITESSPLPVAKVCPSGANATAARSRCGRSGVTRGAAAGPGPAHPTRSPSCRRCRWPGCARPGRTPPRSRESVWPVRGDPSRCGRVGSRTSHKITDLSSLPVARVCPSGANATAYTASVWPVRGDPIRCGRAGSRTSHKITDLVVAAGGQGVPVRGERHRDHGVGVAGQGWPDALRPGRVAHIPQDHRVVGAAGGQGVPVRGERHRVHGVGVAGQG